MDPKELKESMDKLVEEQGRPYPGKHYRLKEKPQDKPRADEKAEIVRAKILPTASD